MGFFWMLSLNSANAPTSFWRRMKIGAGALGDAAMHQGFMPLEFVRGLADRAG